MKSIFVLLLLCSLCACSTTDGIALDGVEGGPAKLQQDNDSLGLSVTLKLLQQQRVDNRLRLAFQLKSNIDYDQELQYRVEWFDDSGMPVEPDSTSWKPLVLHGGQQLVIQASALYPQVAAYHFSVREIVKD